MDAGKNGFLENIANRLFLANNRNTVSVCPSFTLCLGSIERYTKVKTTCSLYAPVHLVEIFNLACLKLTANNSPFVLPKSNFV